MYGNSRFAYRVEVRLTLAVVCILSLLTIWVLLIRSWVADNVQVISIEPQHCAALEAVVSQLNHDYLQLICETLNLTSLLEVWKLLQMGNVFSTGSHILAAKLTS